MARQCMRPGCDQPVAAHVTMDPAGAAVWVDRPGPDAGQSQQLCHLHAETLRTPKGWTVTDRRGGPVMVVPDPVEPDPVAVAQPVIEAEPVVDAEAVVEPEPVVEAEPVVEPEAVEPAPVAQDEPAEVVAGPDVEPDPEGYAQPEIEPASPRRPRRGVGRSGPNRSLLDQALASSGPQRSVLTQPPAPSPQD